MCGCADLQIFKLTINYYLHIFHILFHLHICKFAHLHIILSSAYLHIRSSAHQSSRCKKLLTKPERQSHAVATEAVDHCYAWFCFHDQFSLTIHHFGVNSMP